MIMKQNQSLFSLSIDPVAKSHLEDTARWARFLAIAGMVLLTLALLFSFLMATIWSGNNVFRFTTNGRETEEMTTAMRIVYLVVMIIALAVAFFPLLFLLRFANRMKRALAANEQKNLNEA